MAFYNLLCGVLAHHTLEVQPRSVNPVDSVSEQRALTQQQPQARPLRIPRLTAFGTGTRWSLQQELDLGGACHSLSPPVPAVRTLHTVSCGICQGSGFSCSLHSYGLCEQQQPGSQQLTSLKST